MLELNKVLLTGRLTRDPELKYTSSGTAVCKARVASGRSYFDKASGERKEDTVFIDVDIWGKSAEFTNEYFRKGSGIFVEGRLRQDTWKDKETGKDVTKIAITADRVQFAETKAEAQARTSGGGRGAGSSDPGDGAEASYSGGGPGGGGETRDDLPF